MSRPTPPTYKPRNWPSYNEALKRRGLLTIWFDPEMNWDAAPTGTRGRQQSYSDASFQTCLSMKVLFGMRRSAFSAAPKATIYDAMCSAPSVHPIALSR